MNLESNKYQTHKLYLNFCLVNFISRSAGFPLPGCSVGTRTKSEQGEIPGPIYPCLVAIPKDNSEIFYHPL